MVLLSCRFEAFRYEVFCVLAPQLFASEILKRSRRLSRLSLVCTHKPYNVSIHMHIHICIFTPKTIYPWKCREGAPHQSTSNCSELKLETKRSRATYLLQFAPRLSLWEMPMMWIASAAAVDKSFLCLVVEPTNVKYEWHGGSSSQVYSLKSKRFEKPLSRTIIDSIPLFPIIPYYPPWYPPCIPFCDHLRLQLSKSCLQRTINS